MRIGQIHAHTSALSPLEPGGRGGLRTTAQCLSLPFRPWKSKECSGNLGVWQTASPPRGRSAPGDKKTLQNRGCEGLFKKNNFFFQTILELKVT